MSYQGLRNYELALAKFLLRAARLAPREVVAVDIAPPKTLDMGPSVKAPTHAPSRLSHEFQKDFETATALAGVPKSWATDPDVIAMVWAESRFKPDAKNSHSSAFGLFQILRGNWERLVPEAPYGTTSVVWQAVGGFRYLKAKYRTPQRAKAFMDATMLRDPSLAPPDLRPLASRWVEAHKVGY